MLSRSKQRIEVGKTFIWDWDMWLVGLLSKLHKRANVVSGVEFDQDNLPEDLNDISIPEQCNKDS